jgi:hypothetical protein
LVEKKIERKYKQLREGERRKQEQKNEARKKEERFG